MPEALTNPKARREFEILETFEAGLVLKGTEVKSLRAGKGQIAGGFARVENGEVYAYNLHIDEYTHGNRENHDPKAKRKLLLHKREIRKLFGLTSIKGNALVLLKLYWKNGNVKVALGVGKGKAKADKREDMKRKEAELEIKRAAAHRIKGKR